MIDASDVIKIFLPFPTIADTLACVKHMYVVENTRYSIFAIQTAKPQLVDRAVLKNYLTLEPGAGSPVRRKSYIGMDTRFILENVVLSEKIKAVSGLNPDIFKSVQSKARFVLDTCVINQRELVMLNDGISLAE